MEQRDSKGKQGLKLHLTGVDFVNHYPDPVFVQVQVVDKTHIIVPILS